MLPALLPFSAHSLADRRKGRVILDTLDAQRLTRFHPLGTVEYIHYVRTTDKELLPTEVLARAVRQLPSECEAMGVTYDRPRSTRGDEIPLNFRRKNRSDLPVR
jgi:hypothetical protein